MPIFRTPKKSKAEKLARLTDAQKAELERIEAEAIASFKGDGPELESALGMLHLGHHIGWKVLYIMHSKATIRKYERILTGESKNPVRIRELFPPTGPSSPRNMAFRISQAASNFWKFISGEATDAKADREQRHRFET